MTFISRSSDFSSFIFYSEKHFSFIDKAQFRRATLSCDSSYFKFVFFFFFFYVLILKLYKRNTDLQMDSQ